MSIAYRLLYGVGYTPWKEITELANVRQQVATLLEREERERDRRSGRRSTSVAATEAGAS